MTPSHYGVRPTRPEGHSGLLLWRRLDSPSDVAGQLSRLGNVAGAKAHLTPPEFTTKPESATSAAARCLRNFRLAAIEIGPMPTTSWAVRAFINWRLGPST